MEVIARSSFVRTSPRKLALVVRAVRGLAPQAAIDQLKLAPQRAAEAVLNVFQQAVGNAKNNFKLSPESLIVKTMQVQEGPRFKRRDKGHGARFDSGLKRKRMAHIMVILEAKETK